MTSTDLRKLRPDQWDEWYANLELAFGGVPESPEERETWRALTEFERAIAAWDDGRIVGTAGSFSFRLSVPGGAVVPTAGVTAVSVAATHRRRGVLSAMMRRQLDDVRAAGEPLAILVASEPAIYGRFGYGIASRQLRAEIDTSRVRLTVPPDADGVRLREADPTAVLDACEALYARLVPGRPGMLRRLPGWERLGVLDPESRREGASPRRCVLAEVDGELRGYARFAVRPEWDVAGPKGTVVLHDLEALDPAAYGALWRFLWGIDLTSTLQVGPRPVDDPWQHMVDDARRCGVRFRDSLHLRPVEVGAALAARRYAAPVDVVLEVEDAFCPWNSGRWRLTGDASGAECVRTEAPAGLALTVGDLGAAYLGDTSLTALAGTGRVRELRSGALAEAAGAFSWPVAPWLPHGF
ncbi:GNAT family N-acetyltransferase [Streptomyces sp. TRM43335]|uniref:GNAT family N-acetyltransferase n=1 Tax=Streptomyces taklimakanensis TaxID=2569853 RepID=A0A6G2B9X3_9ACTN|nr:GNAT family N-acetyltransferase [Streptomyces taklimakanensis]MTE19058.1 GNAT family N-acetyltransferase [Streptomyces taklimakanensis]